MEEQLKEIETKLHFLENRVLILEEKDKIRKEHIKNLVETVKMHTNIMDSIAVILHLKDN